MGDDSSCESAALWVTKNKNIWRYDKVLAGDGSQTRAIDDDWELDH